MAIYHFSLKVVKAHADLKFEYIARQGKYSTGKKAEELVADWSGNLPSWATSGRQFWKTIETHEKPGQSRGRTIELALPNELTNEQQLLYTKKWCDDNLNDHAYSVAIHHKNNNPHVHIFFCERKIDRNKPEPDAEHYCKQRSGYSKDRMITGSNRKAWLMDKRKSWEIATNNALELAGQNARVDSRSLKDQGSNRLPQIKVGYKDYVKLNRTGLKGPRYERNERIKQYNQLITSRDMYLKECQKLDDEFEKANHQLEEEKKLLQLEEQHLSVELTAKVVDRDLNKGPNKDVLSKTVKSNTTNQSKAATIERVQSEHNKKIIHIYWGINIRTRPRCVFLRFDDGKESAFPYSKYEQLMSDYAKEIQHYYEQHPEIPLEKRVTSNSLQKEMEKFQQQVIGRQR